MFKLSRYFFLASGTVVIVMTLLLALLYQRNEVVEHTNIAGKRNETLARLLANAVWPDFGAPLVNSRGLDAATLRERPLTRRLHEQLRALSVGVPIIKIKVYDLHGTAVFSSVPREIGEDKSANSGFIAARNGELMSELVHRGRMSATEGEIENVDVVSSYIPIRPDPDGPVQAVFELYADVTWALENIRRDLMRLLSGLGVVFAFFYAVLLLIVGRADRILQRQYLAIKASEASVNAKNLELEAANQRMRLAASVFERSIQGIIITDEQMRVVEVNRAFTEITGYTAAESIGQTPRVLSSGWHDKAFYEALWQELGSKGSWQGEMTNRRKNGEVYTEWLTICTVRNDRHEVAYYIGMFYDISEKRLSEERIARLAYYDTLTGLANRRLFEDRLEQAVHAARRNVANPAVMFIDLDRFKPVNDSFGHKTGDVLLVQVARQLNGAVRDCDTVARLGGDEFAVLLVGDPQDSAGEAIAAHIAQRILDALAKPFVIDNHEITTGASIGISFYPADGDDPETLIKHADVAMYQAKHEGRNRYRFFQPEMNDDSLARQRMEASLHRALARGEFELYFQPQVCAQTNRVVGAEALVRWHHPERGLVLPAEFIPLAEETGLIVPIGRWVLEQACRQVQAWEARLPSGFRLAVNLSALQFRDGLDLTVREVLAATAIAPARIELELKECMLMRDAERAIALIDSLAALGVRFAIDDFGTGYSSLAHLKRVPLHKLKIDRSFVCELPDDPVCSAIAAAAISLAHSLGLEVSAEGVETAAQLAFLRTAGCGEYQGHLFSPPLPAERFAAFLDEKLVLS